MEGSHRCADLSERTMKKYISFFRLRFNMGIQYRAAAAAGVVTQFVWGFMECFLFRAFYEADPAAFPMEFSATVSYVWMQQAFLAVFATWMMDNEIFDMIKNGNIAYELCRPVSVYRVWFARNCALRLSRAALRCVPILLVAVLLPEPFRLTPPADGRTLGMFAVTMALGLLVTVSIAMIVYALSFFTITPQGLTIFFTSAMEFFSGAIIPLPFLPQPLRTITELLPFAGMQNVPLRIYGGDLAGTEMARAVGLQVFWLAALLLLGGWLCGKGVRRIVVQGG